MKWLFALVIAGCGGHGSSKAATPSPSPSSSTTIAEPATQSSLESDPVERSKEKSAPAPAARSVAQRWIAAHNKVRAAHCAPALTWSTKLAAVAQTWADTLKAKGCMFGHSGTSYGENLAAGTRGALDPESTVAMWYDEIKLYTFPAGGFSMKTGHFTQVVWTTTTQVGCGQVTCNGNDIYVCNYDPPGNWEGQYKEHVLPTSCTK
jgi:uncharacterized protein YkwD